MGSAILQFPAIARGAAGALARTAVCLSPPVFVAVLILRTALLGCPFDTSAAQIDVAERSELLQTDPLSLDNDCFGRLMGRLTSARRRPATDSLLLLVERRYSTIAFDNTAMLSLARHASIKSHPGLWLRIVRLWEKKNGPVYQHLARLVQNGSIRQADSLYEAFDADSVFDVHDLMRWANVKHVLEQPLRSADLFCRICDLEPRLVPVALSQLSHQLDDSPRDQAAATLGSFGACYLKLGDADTVALRSWLSETYARMGLFDKEIETLIALETRSSPVTRQLIETARERFIHSDFKNVIAPARLAYMKLPKGDLRSLAATLLYQAYLERGQNDSALLWLSRSDLNSQARTVDAIVLYQYAGQFQKSAPLLDSVDRGLCRDTLTMRQLLYSGKTHEATKFTANLGLSWKRGANDAALWRARTLLFDRQIDSLAALLDSVDVPTSWPGSTEVLKYRYWLQYLGSSKEALDVWARIEYDLYRGKLQQAQTHLQQNRIGAAQGIQLRLRIAEVFMGRGGFAEALSVLQSANSVSATPQFDYVRADALLRTGEVDKARGILEKLILEHPGDIFSSKARVLLSRMQPTS